MRNHHDEAIRLIESPLDYPGLPHHPLARVLLRVWRYPSFQPYASWALIQARKEVLVRRITWDQRHPLADTPVTFGCEAVVEPAVHEALRSSLQGIRLPPFIPVNTVGIDGTTYGVELGSYMRSARLSWWEQPPGSGPRWAPGTSRRSPGSMRCSPPARPASAADRDTARVMRTGPSASTRAACCLDGTYKRLRQSSWFSGRPNRILFIYIVSL